MCGSCGGCRGGGWRRERGGTRRPGQGLTTPKPTLPTSPGPPRTGKNCSGRLDCGLTLPFAFMRPPGLRHRAKYVLNKAVRVHTGADEASYK